MTLRSWRRLAPCVAATLVALSAASARDRGPAPAVSKLTPDLEQTLSASSGPFLVWVFFEDKGNAEKIRSIPPLGLVSARSLQRRAKVMPPSKLVDAADFPVDDRYVRQIADLGLEIRHRSKWFNAVSALASATQIESVARLACVHSIALVTKYRRAAAAPLVPPTTPAPRKGSGPRAAHSIDYGPSLTQLELMHVPALHDRGINGQGVLVGHFDNGVRLPQHQVFEQIHVVARHDFVDGDENPAPNPGDPSWFGAHGTSTLSVLAGYAPGHLVGSAYGADFVLARTENDASETPLEEDNWVAAIEWADSLGIDVASTSLGYLDFDVGFQSHTWRDMDGQTTVITRAADMAVARGILVFNAVGNGGDAVGGLGNTMLAPSDGDSVIAVGGVFPDGTRYTTSSVGPTANQPPRIKPDVMAQGANVHIATVGSTTEYSDNTGTSFACPLAAGVGALLLSVVPAATPMQIRDALRSTATHAANPNNQYGWGVVDATAALAHLTSAVETTSWSRIKGAYR